MSIESLVQALDERTEDELAKREKQCKGIIANPAFRAKLNSMTLNPLSIHTDEEFITAAKQMLKAISIVRKSRLDE